MQAKLGKDRLRNYGTEADRRREKENRVVPRPQWAR
jgi:hypothetical protein